MESSPIFLSPFEDAPFPPKSPSMRRMRKQPREVAYMNVSEIYWTFFINYNVLLILAKYFEHSMIWILSHLTVGQHQDILLLFGKPTQDSLLQRFSRVNHHLNSLPATLDSSNSLSAKFSSLEMMPGISCSLAIQSRAICERMSSSNGRCE